jgi:alpha-galactosidase
MERLDDFTLSLITNDEIIAVNQDVLGKQALPVIRRDGFEVLRQKYLSTGLCLSVCRKNKTLCPVTKFYPIGFITSKSQE